MNEQAVSTTIDIDEAKKVIENSDKELVSAMLVSSGIRTCMTGYEYLKMAVQLYKACLKNNNLIKVAKIWQK